VSNGGLTPVSYLVLGLVAWGARTPYDLKQKVARSVGYFWTFPHSQLYAEPARLAQLGLLDEEQEQHGRRRRVYTVTEAGHAALEEWLREPTSEAPQMRDTALLKLFFGNVLMPDDVVALARAQEQSHRARLAVYEALDETMPRDGETEFPRATLRMGLLFERAFIQFWSSVAADYGSVVSSAPSSSGSL
jgi:DNA-binding PadR family transcriptional regulator